MNSIVLHKKALPSKHLLSLVVSATVALTGASTSWSAQRSSVLEEVIVTAQKREQSANDVGVAISAFSGEQMEALNFSSAADVSSQSPNVEIRRHFVGRGLTTNLFVRGVGNTDLNNGAESPVAAFVDEFYMVSSSTVDFSLFDMARTEVLKGPQGTLFGRNATGGAFAFVTQKPEDEASVFVEGTVGTKGTLGGEVRLNMPVSDDLKLRFSAYHDSHDGLTDNNYPGQSDFRESGFNAYRGQVLYQVTESWETLLKLESGVAEGRLVGDNLRPMQKSGDDVIFAPTTLVTNRVKDPDPFNVSHNSKDWAENQVDHALWTNVWQNDEVTFTSITGFLNQNYDITEDCDASADSVCNFNSTYGSQHYSQEFRLNGSSESLTWTAGVYYMNQDADGGYNLNVFNGLVGDPFPANAGILQHSLFETEVETYAAFGQVEYSLTDTVTLIGGLRVQKDKKDFQQIDVQEIVLVDDFDFDGVRSFSAANLTPLAEPVVLGSNDFSPATAGNLTKLDEDGVSGTLQMNWQPTADSLYYASVRRGIKAGGFNVGVVPLGLPSENWGYDQEVLDAYEIGAKLQLAEGKLRLNMATFYYDYEDYQALSFQNLGQFFVNRPATITGAEFEIFANPIEGLDIVFGASYLDTEVEDVQRGVLESTIEDREMGEAPEKTANLVVRYEFPVPTGYLSLQVDGNYVAQRYADILNQTAATLKPYSVWNSNITYTSENEKFYARLWVKNLADKEVATYRIEITDLLNYGQDNFMEPRMAGLTVGYHF